MAAAMSVSASQQALEDCAAHLERRRAFGRSLSEMQGLRHRLADMATRVEAARALTYHAAGMLAAGVECATEVSMAKLLATEAAVKVGYDAVQLHGGYGYIRGTPVERFARDYRLWTIAAGSSGDHAGHNRKARRRLSQTAGRTEHLRGCGAVPGRADRASIVGAPLGA